MKNTKDILLNLYDTFFLRDFTYVISGCFFLLTLGYVNRVDIVSYIKNATFNIFRFMLFLALSYIIGLFIQEAISLLGIVKTKSTVSSQKKGEYVILIEKISNNYNNKILNILERTIYFKTIGSAICSVSLINCLLLVYSICKHRSPIDSFLFVGMFLIFIFAFILNRRKRDEQDLILEALKKGID